MTHESQQYVVHGRIDSLSSDGSGILRRPGLKTVFVPGALPGEEITAQIVLSKKNYQRAKLLDIVQASEDRSLARCQHFATCGGCQLQHLKSEKQPAIKRTWFMDACQRLGHWPDQALRILSEKLTVRPLPSWHYRRRVRLHYGPNASGSFVLGYALGSASELGSERPVRGRTSQRDPEILEIQECPILHPQLSACIPALMLALDQLNLSNRMALQIELTLVAKASAPSDTRDYFISLVAYREGRERSAIPKALEKALVAGLEKQGIRVLHPDIHGEVHPLDCSDLSEPKRPSPVFHLRGFVQPHIDAGKTYSDIIGDMTDCLSHAKNGPPLAKICAWDLYGGAGLFTSALLGKFGNSIRVTLVEQSPWSSLAAKELFTNENVDIRESDVQFFLQDFLATAPEARLWPDLIIADPPRSGLGSEVVKLLIEFSKQAKRNSIKSPVIIFVFCDPGACARDIGALLAAGFGIQDLVLIDAFAQTRHYECIVHVSFEKEQSV